MAQSHKGSILPIENQMVPISKDTAFHANYDHHLDGLGQGKRVSPHGELYALDFDGNSYIDMGDVQNMGTSDMTISAWFKTTATSVWILSKSKAAGQYYRYAMEVYSTGVLRFIVAWNSTGHTDYIGTVVVNDGKWHNATVSIDRNKFLSIYIDGVLDKTFDISSFNGLDFISNNPFRIGSYTKSDNVSPYNSFIGSISDVRMWNLALSHGGVRDNIQRKLNGPEPNLTGYWPLSEKEGFVSFDYSSNQNDGVWNGTPKSAWGRTIAIQKNEGKFKGAVSIEPDTANMVGTSSGALGEVAGASAWNDFKVTINGYTTVPTPFGNREVAHVAYVNDPNHSTSSGGGIRYGYGAGGRYPATSSSKYVYSYYMKLSSNYHHPNFIYIRQYDSAGTHITEGGVSSSAQKIDCGNGWYRYWGVFTPGTSTATVHIDHYAYDGNGNEFWFFGGQLEKDKDYPTTFIEGSRPLGRLWYPKDLINQSAFTVSCWFNIPWMHRDNANSRNAGIMGNWYHPIMEFAPVVNRGNTGNSLSICAGPVPSSFDRKIILKSPGGVTGTKAIQDDTWYHMICTYDGTTYRLYIDGELECETTSTFTIYDDTLLMVGGGYQGKAFIKIDEVRIERRAISIDEVEAWAISGLHYNYLDYSQEVD